MSDAAVGWTDDIAALKIEAQPDGGLMLEQEANGEVDRVLIHPLHLRLMAERMGLVREVSASDAELLRTERGRVADLARENAQLKRTLLTLHGKVMTFHKNFVEGADWDHADLSAEMWQLNGLADLFDMVVDGFTDDVGNAASVTAPLAHRDHTVTGALAEPRANPTVTQGEPNANPRVAAQKANRFPSSVEDPRISQATPPKAGQLGRGRDAASHGTDTGQARLALDTGVTTTAIAPQ